MVTFPRNYILQRTAFDITRNQRAIHGHRMAGLSLKLLASWRIEGIPWLIQRESQLSNFIGNVSPWTHHGICIA